MQRLYSSVLLAVIALTVAAQAQKIDQCGICQDDQVMACVSKTQYVLCKEEEMTTTTTMEDLTTTTTMDEPITTTMLNSPDTFDITASTKILSCAADEVCISETFGVFGKVCVPQCVVEFGEFQSSCSNEEYIAPPEVPNEVEMEDACVSQLAGNAAKPYFYALNPLDPHCRSYVYCEKTVTDTWTAIYLKCANNKYYNLSKKICQVAKPDNCLA